MTEPSAYELNAWRNIQQFKGRPLSQAMRNVGEQVANGAEKLGERANQYLESQPRAQAVVVRGQRFAAKSAHVVSTKARAVATAIPDGLSDWGGAAFGSMRQAVGKVSRAGLSPTRVVAKHQKKGHDVTHLFDLRGLDLEQIDAVRRRGTNWIYPAIAAASGAAAGAVITGGEGSIAITGGAAAAPSGAAITGALLGDAAVVQGLASRCVGHVSLLYGYDPEDPAEKLFVMSVLNAGTAMSTSAKYAAMADISKLTQALYRGRSWAVLLDTSVVAQVSKKFTEKFIGRLTKQGLGKVVPAAGIALGGAFNWTTLEGVVDVADTEYRRRFLLEKYPHLADEEAVEPVCDLVPEGAVIEEDAVDEEISVLDEIVEAGGPDLR
jgi:uncharacterized protein (DUF697 family)